MKNFGKGIALAYAAVCVAGSTLLIGSAVVVAQWVGRGIERAVRWPT